MQPDEVMDYYYLHLAGKGLVIREIKLLPLPAGLGRNVGGGVRALRDQGNSRCRTSFDDKAPHVTMSSPSLLDAQAGLPNPPELKRPRLGARVLGLSLGSGGPHPHPQAISGGPATRK